MPAQTARCACTSSAPESPNDSSTRVSASAARRLAASSSGSSPGSRMVAAYNPGCSSAKRQYASAIASSASRARSARSPTSGARRRAAHRIEREVAQQAVEAVDVRVQRLAADAEPGRQRRQGQGADALLVDERRRRRRSPRRGRGPPASPWRAPDLQSDGHRNIPGVISRPALTESTNRGFVDRVRRSADRDDGVGHRRHDRRHRAAVDRARPRRGVGHRVGRHRVPPVPGRDHAPLRQDRRRLRPQARVALRDRPVHARVHGLRAGAVDAGAAGGARGAGPRRRWSPGARHGDPGRPHPTPAARTLARVPGDAVRGRGDRRAR